MGETGPPGSIIATVGHSTRPLGTLLDLLERSECRVVVDVRSLPRSRRFPQFNRETLAAVLEERGCLYRHCAPLGGLRRPLPAGESINTGLRNERFRAYADHMQTAGFDQALDRLIERARSEPTVLLCAEAVPWRCHRFLIADALVARGCRVLHIIDQDRTEWHRLRREAVVREGRVSYPDRTSQRRLDL